MKRREKRSRPLQSLKHWISEYPERFPVNYRKLDEQEITPEARDANFLEAYAKCSAYKAEAFLLFMHHFPISKPEKSHE